MGQLSEKEKKIIVELRKNSRQSIKNISQKYGYPISTVFDVMHKMERNGVLFHNSNVDFEKIGYPVKMYAAIKSDYKDRNKIAQYLMSHKNVNSLSLVNSNNDFHIEGIFRNQGDVFRFLEELNQSHNIRECNAYHVIDTLHENRFLTEERHFE